jgi:hypothetical protein
VRERDYRAIFFDVALYLSIAGVLYIYFVGIRPRRRRDTPWDAPGGGGRGEKENFRGSGRRRRREI